MGIWRFRSFSNNYTVLLPVDGGDFSEDVFELDGSPKTWTVRPRLRPFIEKNKKKQKPLSDISYVTVGSVILNSRAYACLKDLMAPFGQFLEVECLNEGGLLGSDSVQSQIYYLYNVTNIIACIDYEKSEKIGSGVFKPAFFPDAIPKDPQIFKDPLNKTVEIYLSGPAKAKLEKLIVEAALTGAVFEQVA